MALDMEEKKIVMLFEIFTNSLDDIPTGSEGISGKYGRLLEVR
jgi:hypothetical protein